MQKINLDNKNQFICKDDFILIQYLKDSKSGRIKKDNIARVSKHNANYLVKHGIAKII